MTYSAGELIAIIGAIVTGLCAIAGAIGAVIIAYRTGAIAKGQEIVTARTETLLKTQVVADTKLDVIHNLTNDRLTRIDSKLADTEAKLEAALKTISENETRRTTLALVTASAVSGTPIPAVPQIDPSIPVVELELPSLIIKPT